MSSSNASSLSSSVSYSADRVYEIDPLTSSSTIVKKLCFPAKNMNGTWAERAISIDINKTIALGLFLSYAILSIKFSLILAPYKNTQQRETEQYRIWVMTKVRFIVFIPSS